MSDVRCTRCGMIFEAGRSYGYVCPSGGGCSFVPLMPVAPVTLPPMIGTRDVELTARIAALEAEAARLRDALEQTKAKAATKARAARRWRAKAEGGEAGQ